MKQVIKTILITVSLAGLYTGVHAGDIRVNLESPDGSFHKGVETIRGWAISTAGIDRVELFIDGQFISLLPQGGTRGDVGAAFPDFPNSENSGFAIAFNFDLLSTGTVIDGDFVSTVGLHQATVRVVDNDGDVEEVTNEFINTRFIPSRFIQNPLDSVSFNFSTFTPEGPEFVATDVLVDNQAYSVLYQWLPVAQAIRPVLIVLQSEIPSLDTAQASIQIQGTPPKVMVDLYQKVLNALKN